MTTRRPGDVFFWFILAVLAAIASPEIRAASFDCGKARTTTEKAICADPLLSRLDEQLDDAYRVAQKRVQSRRALRDQQRVWLATRRDVCSDAACLRAAYTARIEALLDESAGDPTTETLEINATKAREPYTLATGRCGGFPRLNIGMAEGLCAGLVAGPTQSDPTRQIRMPRSLLELDARTWLVTDLGAWSGKRGAVWRLRLGEGKSATIEPLIQGLQQPHSLARGPDGRVYVSEMSRIFRFDPIAPNPASTMQTVIGDLPDNRLHANRHPIAAFLFDADGALLVNVGAPSDQCLGANGKRAGGSCAESDTGEMAASLRRYPLTGDAMWSRQYTVHARGLRNSVALVRHPAGAVLQAENSYDFEARLRPFEEVNLITANKHYGWPYCYDNDRPSPGWEGLPIAACQDTQRYAAPVLLLPPHSSPLAMTYYEGRMFPQLKGMLLMTWHGFRSVGGRIAAFEVDAGGVPVRSAGAKFPVYGGDALAYDAANAASAFILTPAWNKVIGMRPQGSPVGLAVASDGAIWTTDDRAGLVIRIASDAGP